MHLPPEKQILLNTITELLSSIPGVKAVALGGSYARGTQREGSDLDVAIYYASLSRSKIFASFRHLPDRYVERLSAILARPGLTAPELMDSTRALHELWSSVVALVGGTYKPAFRLQ